MRERYHVHLSKEKMGQTRGLHKYLFVGRMLAKIMRGKNKRRKS